MSNYTKTTDFEAKDSLPSGDSGKIIRGSEFETEFDNIATAIATKADAASPTFTGTVTIDGLTVNGNTTLGNAATDTVTVTADIASNLIPSADDTYNLGASGAEWNDLYVDGVAYIDTINGFAATGDVNFGDNNKAQFGAGNDLQIFHDGSNSRIKDNGTGGLYVQGSSFISLTNAAATETYVYAAENGAVQLKYDNSTKLATTSTGVDVTGTVTADGLTVDTSAGVTLNGTGTGATHQINRGTGATNNTRPVVTLNADSTGDAADGFGASIKFELSDTAVDNSELGAIGFKRDGGDGLGMFAIGQDSQLLHTNRQFTVAANGDVSFYEDTGTTAKFFWDASAERLGLGTTSPGATLDVDGTVDIAPSSGDAQLKILNSSDVGRSLIYFSDPSGIGGRMVYNHASNFMSFETNGTNEAMRIDSTGRVGIGTTSPSSALDVQDNASSVISGTNEALLRVRNTAFDEATIGSTYVGHTQGGDTVIANTRATDGVGDIKFYTKTSGGVQERMTVDSSGNVGIGTSSPAQLLHVESASGSDASLQLKVGDTTSSTNILFGDSGATAAGAIRYRNNGNSLAFDTASSEAMRIDSSGNVLVGTTSQISSGKISVAGGTSANGITATTAATSGYSAASFQRTASDGNLIGFKKGATTVGSIGTHLSRIHLSAGAGGIFLDGGGTPAIWPWKSTATTSGDADDEVTLGDASNRWANLYLSGGVYLGGTSQPNKLDDYEEGTWTPTISGGTSGSITGFTVNAADYTKIGDVVHAYCFLTGIDMTSSTISGNYVIGGLPITASSNRQLVVVAYCNMFSFDETDITISGYAAANTIILRKGSSVTAVSDGDESANVNTSIMIGITYNVT